MRHDNLKLEMLAGSRPGEKIMVLDGVLTADTAFHFRDSVRAQQPPTLVVDMTNVNYVDSSGLGVLIGAYVSSSPSTWVMRSGNQRLWYSAKGTLRSYKTKGARQ